MRIDFGTPLPARDARPPANGIDKADALEATLRDMADTLSSDFVDGRVGKRHNTFEHRSRVLRQLTARLARMRTQEPARAL